ncbi:MAG TPA: hypothetical protein VGL05_34940 [Kribbella sp.]
MTVRITEEPLPDLATADTEWEVGEELATHLDGELYLAPLMGQSPAYSVYTPAGPGLHLVRVFARGRTTHYDAVVWEPSEEYEVTITPVSSAPGRRTTRGDGLYLP